MKKEFEKRLMEVLAEPTAPFRERCVLVKAIEILKATRVPYFSDLAGNIVVGFGSEAEYRARLRKKTPEPLRVYVAHTDHPGFHGVKWEKPGVLSVKWHGGTPTRFLNGGKVWLADGKRVIGSGVVAKAKLYPSKAALDTSVITGLPKEWFVDPADPKRLYGAFQFKEPVWKKGDRLYTKAADDLVGVTAILQLAAELFADQSPERENFVGVLTRAEEVGFVGAIAHFTSPYWLERQANVLGVSLETSRTLPGALIGGGPVVRLGDRATVFDAGALHLFTKLADEVLPKKYQRRIMDGGTCEGTVLTTYGIPTVAISVPLGNYHNQSFEGGPGSRGPKGPAPEFVALSDIEGMAILCRALLRKDLGWDRPWEKKVEEFAKRKASYDGLLHPVPNLDG